MANSMRVLGALCVAAALVLSTGGVAYRIKADPQPEASHAAPVEPIAKTEQAPDSGTCPAPEGASSRPVVIQLERSPSANEFISLNTSGYNYSDPRRVPAAAPRRPSSESESTEPAGAESPVPATPQDGE